MKNEKMYFLTYGEMLDILDMSKDNEAVAQEVACKNCNQVKIEENDYMFERLTIWAPQVEYEHSSLVQLDETERAFISERLKRLDNKWKTPLDTSVWVNSYKNDDYLLVAGMLQEVRDIHKKIYYNNYKSEWVCGQLEIPYIHLDFVERAALSKDEYGNYTPDDKKLNIGVKEPLQNGAYRLEFNYYWLKQYLKFLQKIFDSNEEIVCSLPDEVDFGPVKYSTREKLLFLADTISSNGLKTQADILRMYANSGTNPEKIEEPCLTYLNEGNHNLITWGFFGEDGKSIKIPMKKTIYNTSGFAHWFERRVELVSEIFLDSIKMILAHETAHVARGHWNLRTKEPDYSMRRDVMMNCEINADWTAAVWMLNELLYNTANGNPHYNILRYTRKELVEQWAIRVLAIYVCLSWTERNDNRIWSEKTIEDFVNRSEATHPVYQFRLFCTLGHIRKHLDPMKEKNRENGYAIRTLDDTPLDDELFNMVWQYASDMIFSFEYAFHACWNEDERTEWEKIRQGLLVVENATPEKNTEVPFLMCYMDKAKEELEQYEREWPAILSKLRKCGMYFKM